MNPLAQAVIQWQTEQGRHDLPWQQQISPYRVWVSEIMLQQTRVESVIPYFQSFMHAFPSLESLAQAPLDQVLALWSGLGYYSRARNLHKAAQQALAQWGQLPESLKDLQSLPGIGRSTAGAIYSLGFGHAAPILDGNVKRLFCRNFAVHGWPGESRVQKHLWQLAETHLPAQQCARYNQGLMDLGATVCTRQRPRCEHCPLEQQCQARAAGLTHELPQPRPRKTLPEKHCTLWWLAHENRLLLWRRPEQGLWGGLWSLPQQGAGADLPPWLQTSLQPQTGESLRFRHTFTHFHLHIGVRESTLSPLPPELPENWHWQPMDQLEQLGLPAPIRRIARSLRNTT